MNPELDRNDPYWPDDEFEAYLDEVYAEREAEQAEEMMLAHLAAQQEYQQIVEWWES